MESNKLLDFVREWLAVIDDRRPRVLTLMNLLNVHTISNSLSNERILIWNFVSIILR